MDNPAAASRKERRALRVSVVGSLFLAVIGFGFAMQTHSDAILLDAVVSLIGLGVSILTLFMARLVELPSDETFPFGYAHFEPILNVFKSLIMVTICVFALVASIGSILHGGKTVAAGVAVIYALISTFCSVVVGLYMHHSSRQTASTLIAVDAKAWLLDGVISAAVLLTFMSMYLLEESRWAHYLPYMDSGLVAILVICALPVPLKILKDNMREVLSMAPPSALQERIRQQVLQALEGQEYEGIHLRTMKQGRQITVFVHITLGRDFVLGSIVTLDRIRTRIAKKLQGYDSNIGIQAVFIGDPKWAE
jgi:cation diffusion facilitator family transporter